MTAHFQNVYNLHANVRELPDRIYFDKPKVSVGQSEGCDVLIHWEGEEKGLLAVDQHRGDYYLSAQGLPVFLNNIPVDKPVRLRHRDSITIGRQYVFCFVHEESKDKDGGIIARNPVLKNLTKKVSTLTVDKPSQTQGTESKKMTSTGKIAPIPIPPEESEVFSRKMTRRLQLDPAVLKAMKTKSKRGVTKPIPSPGPLTPPIKSKRRTPAPNIEVVSPFQNPMDVRGQQDATLIWEQKDDSRQYVAELISPSNGQILSLDREKVIIGRLPTCDMCLLDDFVSREQLELAKTPIGFLLKNIGKNEVIVEKKSVGSGEGAVLPQEEKTLKAGEVTLLAQEATIFLGRQVLYYFNTPDIKMSRTEETAETQNMSHLHTSARDRKYHFYRGLAEQKEELIKASQLQKVLTPFCSKFDDLDIGVWFKYCAIDNLSGDFFSYHKKQQSLFLCLGDVSGHGPAAALLASHISGMFKVLAAEKDSCHTVISSMHNHLVSQERVHDDYALATVVNMTPGAVEICIAGNAVPPLYYSASKTNFSSLNTPSTPMGMMRLGGLFRPYTDSWEFGPNDMLIMFTDGVTEAEMSDGSEIGYERVCKQLEAQVRSQVPSEEFLDVFLEWLNSNSEIHDDLSMVLIATP